jgi:hypothetical protein
MRVIDAQEMCLKQKNEAQANRNSARQRFPDDFLKRRLSDRLSSCFGANVDIASCVVPSCMIRYFTIPPKQAFQGAEKSETRAQHRHGSQGASKWVATLRQKQICIANTNECLPGVNPCFRTLDGFLRRYFPVCFAPNDPENAVPFCR